MRRTAGRQGTWPDAIPPQGLAAFRIMFKHLTEAVPKFGGAMLSEVFNPYLEVRMRRAMRTRMYKGYGKASRILDTTEAERWEQCQRRVAVYKRHLRIRRDRFEPLFQLFSAWSKAELTPIRNRHWRYRRKIVYTERVTEIPRYRRRLSRSVKDITSLIEHGFTVSELVQLASMGDMQSFFRLVELDKCFLTSSLMKDWVWRMHSRHDTGFFEGLSEAVSRDTFEDHKSSVRLGIACYLLWFLGWDRETNRDLLAFIEAEGLAKYDDPKSFDTLLRRIGLRRYKMQQKTR